MKHFALGCIVGATSKTAHANILDDLEGRWEAKVFDHNRKQYSLSNLCGDGALDIQIHRSTRELVVNRKDEPELRYSIENIGPSHMPARPKGGERDEKDIGKKSLVFSAS